MVYKVGACNGCKSRQIWLQSKLDRSTRALQSIMKVKKSGNQKSTKD